MDSIIAIVFGIVQGLTEFIPVSSSGHLLLLHEIFPNFDVTDELSFDVALHMGTLLALLIFFWKDVVRYFVAWLTSIREIAHTSTPTIFSADQRLAWLLILAMIPAGVVGFFFEDVIEQTFRSTGVVIVMLIAVAIVFLLVESMKKTQGISLEHITWRQALFVGLLQTLALVPGTSRSGITIVAGMIAGVARADAARFSFLLSIPIIAAAGLKKGLDLVSVGIAPSALPILLLSMASAGIVGYLAIAGLLKYLKTHSLAPFAWYRIALGAVLIIFFYIF